MAEMAETEETGEKRGWGDEEAEEERAAKKRMTEKSFGERQELQAYESLVIKVKEIVGTDLPDLKKDLIRRKCLVCQVHSFVGWKGLLDHARTFARRKMQEHRGYHRALVEVLTPRHQEKSDKPVEKTTETEAEEKPAGSKTE